MDILRPDLMWIEGRCYRINPQESSLSGHAEDEQFDDEYEEEDVACPPDEHDDDFEIETIENGRYRTSFSVPRFYHSFIIGTKGMVRRRLETETRTQIKVPRQGQNGFIVVIGTSKSGVSAARRRIDLVVMSARWRQPFTHFISLPMNGENLKQNFLVFKDRVLKTCCNSRGVDESIFQSPEKLHITIGTLVLLDTYERETAVHIFNECKKDVIEPLMRNKSLMVHMTGIEYMNDDPAEVDVLYGRVHVKDGCDDILQELADKTVDYFVSKEIMKRQYERVKLHVTLMNTLFRNEESSESEADGPKRKQKPRESFDASKIFNDFQDYEFGDQELNSMHVSLRYSKAPNGYYQPTAEFSFRE